MRQRGWVAARGTRRRRRLRTWLQHAPSSSRRRGGARSARPRRRGRVPPGLGSAARRFESPFPPGHPLGSLPALRQRAAAVATRVPRHRSTRSAAAGKAARATTRQAGQAAGRRAPHWYDRTRLAQRARARCTRARLARARPTRSQLRRARARRGPSAPRPRRGSSSTSCRASTGARTCSGSSISTRRSNAVDRPSFNLYLIFLVSNCLFGIPHSLAELWLYMLLYDIPTIIKYSHVVYTTHSLFL